MWDTRRRKKQVEDGLKTLGDFEPEDRLILAMVGGVGFCVTMFGFAWSAEYNSVHWFVPTLFGTFLGTALILIFVGFLNYLVDAYLMYAASAIAANTIARSACGAAAPLFTDQMFHALGVGGGGSLVGGMAAVLAIIPFAFYKYGKAIRIRSKFAPTKETPQQRQRDEEGDPTEYHVDPPTDRHSTSSETVAPSDLGVGSQEKKVRPENPTADRSADTDGEKATKE